MQYTNRWISMTKIYIKTIDWLRASISINTCTINPKTERFPEHFTAGRAEESESTDSDSDEDEARGLWLCCGSADKHRPHCPPRAATPSPAAPRGCRLPYLLRFKGVRRVPKGLGKSKRARSIRALKKAKNIGVRKTPASNAASACISQTAGSKTSSRKQQTVNLSALKNRVTPINGIFILDKIPVIRIPKCWRRVWLHFVGGINELSCSFIVHIRYSSRQLATLFICPLLFVLVSTWFWNEVYVFHVIPVLVVRSVTVHVHCSVYLWVTLTIIACDGWKRGWLYSVL